MFKQSPEVLVQQEVYSGTVTQIMEMNKLDFDPTAGLGTTTLTYTLLMVMDVQNTANSRHISTFHQ
jgi:hypothetical protein